MTTINQERTLLGGIRAVFGISSVLAVVVGILILVWPGRTAMLVTALIAVFVILAGISYGALGLFGGVRGVAARVGHIVLGILFIGAGIVAFANLSQTTAWLAVFLGVLVGILWIVEGIVSLTTIAESGSKFLTVLFALVSVVAGIILLFSPLWGAVVLWWVLGISLVVMGAVGIVRALSWGRRR